MVKLCNKKRGESRISGDLYIGSTTCSGEMEELCKKGISGKPCEYLKEHEKHVYGDAMDRYCFGNNRDKNINKSACHSYYKDNYNTNIGNNLRNFCASIHKGKPRYQNKD